MAYLPFPTIWGPIRAPKRPHIHPKNTSFPNIFVVVANIRNSTPKMTPLTISSLQPISNLSGTGVSTIHNHRGPRQSPKTVTHTPKNNCFPSIFVFVANIRYSTPKMTPKWPHVHPKKHHFLTQSSPFIVETAPSPPSREHLFYHPTCRLIFCVAQKCSVLFV